jgi:signal recognition particle receptor subunit beta
VVGTPIFDELRDLFGASPADLGPHARAEQGSPVTARPPAKIIVTGGRGAGKTTFVGSVSDTHPITVEAATDFGRITLHPDLVLYLFGTSEPGHTGFTGALGAVVLVDPRRVEDAFAMISYFENSSDVPFVVAVNTFDDELPHELDEVQEALALAPQVPLITCDARDPGSAANVLQELVSYTMNIEGKTPLARGDAQQKAD